MKRAIILALSCALAGCASGTVRFTPSGEATAPAVAVSAVQVVNSQPAGTVEVGKASSSRAAFFASACKDDVIEALAKAGASFVVLAEKPYQSGGTNSTNMIEVNGTGYRKP